MLPVWSGALSLVALAIAALQSSAPADLVITARTHHLRSGADREWAEFPERAEGAELVIPFDARPNAVEHTLRVRHRDLKQLWRVLVNGIEVARLPYDEADTITYWAVPEGRLRAGRNELRILCAGKASDDVLIGPVALLAASRERVLTEAVLDLSVHDRATGRPTPSRITVVDRNGTLVSFGNPSGPENAVRPGVVYSRTGRARLALPAGRYVIYAGRGFEYSIARQEVELAPGANVARRLLVERQVDTAGWAAMDTHVHTGTFAKHGDASIEERMLTIAGEGIELPVSTEHNVLVDFEARARAAGVREHFTPIVGSEVTTAALGHFNVFPIAPSAPAIDQRAPGWLELRHAMERAGDEPAIVLNHGRDVHAGFRPLGRARHISVAGEDLEGRSLPANAMEVVNSGAVMTDALALPRDWMGMLNRGLILTPVGSSDSHDVSRYIVGQARTYVRCDDKDPRSINVAEAILSVRRSHVMVSYGLLTELEVNGKGPGELAHADGVIDVRIRVKGPGWTRADRVALYANGIMVREEVIAAGTKAGVKWEGTWRLSASHDVHLVAIATGPGVTAPYWPTAKPYQPTSIEFTGYVLGLSGVVFVDTNGDGRFDSALDYARSEVAAAKDVAALIVRLASYDTAVAIQAASVLRARDGAGFESTVRSVLEAAPPHVANGFTAYLEEWRQSQAARGQR